MNFISGARADDRDKMGGSSGIMWYPTKIQWLVIWLTTVLCLVAWLLKNPPIEAFIMPFALIGVLFVWQISADFKRTKD